MCDGLRARKRPARLYERSGREHGWAVLSVVDVKRPRVIHRLV
jgi:hypothetical protein